MQTVSFSFRLGHSTVCNIIEETCQAIWEALSHEFLQPPSNTEEWKQLSDGFERLWNFPHCLGAIDGKHIQMQASANCGSKYYNYKGLLSIVLMAVCDYNYCFTLLDIGDYGIMGGKVTVEFSAIHYLAEQWRTICYRYLSIRL